MSRNFQKQNHYSPGRNNQQYNDTVPNSNSKLFPFGSSSKNQEELTEEAPLGYIDETGAYRTNVNNQKKYMYAAMMRREPPGAQETFIINQRPRTSQSGLILTQEPLDVSPARVVYQQPYIQKIYATPSGEYLIAEEPDQNYQRVQLV